MHERLFGSEEAAVACARAFQLECEISDIPQRRAWEAEGVENAWEDYDEDEVELRKLRYAQALRRLGRAFPELELQVSEQVEGVQASEHNSRPCPCGHGRLAQWPWLLQTQELGFCRELECCALECWRGEWIPDDMAY